MFTKFIEINKFLDWFSVWYLNVLSNPVTVVNMSSLHCHGGHGLPHPRHLGLRPLLVDLCLVFLLPCPGRVDNYGRSIGTQETCVMSGNRNIYLRLLLDLNIKLFHQLLNLALHFNYLSTFLH